MIEDNADEPLPPPPPELLDYFRQIADREDVPDDVREAARVLSKHAEDRRIPTGFARGSLALVGRAEGHAPPLSPGFLTGEARVTVDVEGDLTNAVEQVKSSRVRDYLRIAATRGPDAVRWVDAVLRISTWGS